MKGIIFTEFLEMVEQKFGPQTCERMIENSNLESCAAYTAVGKYPIEEMVALISSLSKLININSDDLLKSYGEYMLPRFTEIYPSFFNDINDSFDFLKSIDNFIRAEVHKLYPETELPKITCEEITPGVLRVDCISPYGLGDFTEGLIKQCTSHFKDNISFARRNVKDPIEYVEFTLKKAL